MDLRIFWSDRLETMADGMLGDWLSRPVRDPFERTCVVVGDMATRNWLRDRFLLHSKSGARRVLANVDFVPLPEFVNDWLAAAVHGSALRNPSDHPFSKDVMAWRIDAVLRDKADDPDFRKLADYVAAGDGGAPDRRRFDLATRLAQMFDDYLVSRHAMLEGWERGRIPEGGDERWQALLYRELARGTASYASDYRKALDPGLAASRAFENGFPRYAAVHVFDVADAPWPWMSMLKKLADEVPVTFWTFNPSRDFWLEDPTKKQALRERAARLRLALERAEAPEEAPELPDFSSPDARLLGALASGFRGMLAHQLDLTDGDCVWRGDEPCGTFASLRSVAPEVHVCHSPRRELEAARDALHRFFDEHPDAKPSDALVLCPDWATYSPLVEAVFGGEDGATLPIATAGIAASTPVAHSFGDLLAFRTNRFALSDVFALLGVPEIRGKFGIDADGLTVLRDLAQKENIHWGYDDEDVAAILRLEEPPEDGRCRFTWRRGIDRMTLDALLGPREDEEDLYEAGAIGRLLPGGHVESDRAVLVGALQRFTGRLMALRRFLQAPHSAEEWRKGLFAAIDDFYQTQDASMGEILGLRKAVDSVAVAAIRARKTDRRPKGGLLSGEVFCLAAVSAVQERSRPIVSAGDAVRIAPLSSGAAVPALFVWICGLNNGTFPRAEFRPSFDLIGRRPTLFDVSPRERDGMALLKAALGARSKLCLSYVGRDVRTNKEIPPSVLLTDLLDWFRQSGVESTAYVHPLQAYSEKYFKAESGLPPSYSAANQKAAAALAAARAKSLDEKTVLPKVVPFPLREDGETTIDLDDLAAFLVRPNRFLVRNRLNVRTSNPKYDQLHDEDDLGGAIPGELRTKILFQGVESIGDPVAESEKLLESGVSLPPGDAAERISNLVPPDEIEAFQKLVISFAKGSEDQERFGCPAEPLAKRYMEYMDGTPVAFESIPFDVDSKSVRLAGSLLPPVAMKNAGGASVLHALVFLERRPGPSDYADAWVRHLVRQLVSGPVVTALFWPAKVHSFHPVAPDEARRRLQRILELATSPMELDLQKARGASDEIPPDFAEPMDHADHLKYKGKRGSKGGAAK